MEAEKDADKITKRIKADMEEFYINLKEIESNQKGFGKVIEASKNYAKDAESYLSKGDFYSSFACISYAHGLIDALKELQKS